MAPANCNSCGSVSPDLVETDYPKMDKRTSALCNSCLDDAVAEGAAREKCSECGSNLEGYLDDSLIWLKCPSNEEHERVGYPLISVETDPSNPTWNG